MFGLWTKRTAVNLEEAAAVSFQSSMQRRAATTSGGGGGGPLDTLVFPESSVTVTHVFVP